MYLQVVEYLQVEQDKIYLPLLTIVGTFFASPILYVATLFDRKKGNLVRQTVKLSLKFVLLGILGAFLTKK